MNVTSPTTDNSVEGLELAYLQTLVRAKASEANMKRARYALREMLDWALANPGTPHEFVKCYTYPTGELPAVIQRAKETLRSLYGAES